MSDLKIPKDTISTTPQPGPEKIPAKGSAPSSPVDSLAAYSADTQGIQLTKRKSDAPELSPPAISLEDYYEAMSSATRGFKEQLAASGQVDIKVRRQRSLSAVNQSLELQALIDEKARALANLDRDAAQALTELQKKIEQMEREGKPTKDWIDQIEISNPADKQHYLELAQAYRNYVDKLKSIGVVVKDNGTFIIPDEAKEKFKALTQEYQRAVDQFNRVCFPGMRDAWVRVKIAPLDRAIQGIVLFWQFTRSIQDSLKSSIPDPLLNTKPLAQRLLPEATQARTSKIVNETETTGINLLLNPEVDSNQLETILGRVLMKRAMADLQLKITAEKKTETADQADRDNREKINDQQLEKLADKPPRVFSRAAGKSKP